MSKMTNNKLNRPIKFRAWDKELEEMIEWDIYAKPAPTNENQLADNQIPLMQFTGLNDKNDKEIYEGDIVKIGESIATIEWRHAGFMVVGVEPPWKKWELVGNNLGAAGVIGNIYENPELLGDQDGQ